MMSTASLATSLSPPGTVATPAAEKIYVCTEDGCGKSFVRSEHLSRHQLNHRPRKVFSCDRCPKEFVRPDLYRRHRARHEKGMWYRNVGGVVKRPSQPQKANLQTPPSTDETADAPETESSHRSKSPVTPAPQSTRPEADFEDPFDTISLREESTHDNILAEKDNIHNGNNSTGLGLFYESPVERTHDVLIPDGTTGMQDLPDNLEWFFEMTQPDLLGNVDLSAMNPSSSFLNAPVDPILSFSHQVPRIVPPPPYDTSWSLVQSKLLAALHTLPLELLESPFFYQTNLAMFYDSYFKNYHNHFPFLHQPSLSSSVTEIPPLLMAAILTLGSSLATDPGLYEVGLKIHDSLRWLIFATGAFVPPAPLWCLQALLLVQAQGKMIATTKHHEMAHIFHGAILTMMKRGRAYSIDTPVENSTQKPLLTSWRQWIEEESTRRTAFFAFLMDAQHASVFGHTPVLSVSDMRLRLPCSESLWNAPTAEAWEEMLHHLPKAPQFLPTLKALLGKTFVPSNCSHFSRFILLHGLLSLTTHLHATDSTTLGIEVGKLGSREANTNVPTVNWMHIIARAIETWSFSLLSLDPSLCLEAAEPLHRIAYITLYANISDFHTVAKDPALLDNFLSKKEYSKAWQRIRHWSRKEESKKAIQHSLLLVKETIFKGRRYRARDDNLQLRPWCLYHGTLVLWAYGVATEGPSNEGAMMLGAEEYVVRLLSSLQDVVGVSGGGVGTSSGGQELQSTQVQQQPQSQACVGANLTRGLLVAVRDALEGCRWELLQEAFVTLDRLIGA